MHENRYVSDSKAVACSLVTKLLQSSHKFERTFTATDVPWKCTESGVCRIPLFENCNSEATFSFVCDSHLKFKRCTLPFSPLCNWVAGTKLIFLKRACARVSLPGPEPEDQPVLHPDQQHCLSTCRQPLLHPPSCHARTGWQQGLRLRFCHQSHLNTGEQGQRDNRWDLHTGLQMTAKWRDWWVMIIFRCWLMHDWSFSATDIYQTCVSRISLLLIFLTLRKTSITRAVL